MPGQRLSHPEQGTSRKVNALSDFDYRVFEQTKLSSDDFGVMPYDASVLRAENLRLRKATEKQVADALRRIVLSGLLIAFVHQDEAYVCAPVWQTWQQIRFPRKTSRPCPPPSVLAQCDDKTQKLFAAHPGGKTFTDSSRTISEKPRESSREDSGSSSEELQNPHSADVRLIPANANANANAYANAHIPEGGPGGNHPLSRGSLGQSPLAMERHREKFAFYGDRLKIPHVLHHEFSAKLGKFSDRLPDWYLSINDGLAASGEPMPDVFEWLRPKFKVWAATMAGESEMAKFLSGEV
jgi:hypothetical protein